MFTKRFFNLDSAFALIAISAMLAVGCGGGDNNPAAPQDEVPPTQNNAMSGSVYVNPTGGVFPAFGATNLDGYLATGNPTYAPANAYVNGYFFPNQTKGVYAGQVAVNSVAVDTLFFPATQGKPAVVVYVATTQAVKFDGSNHNWAIAGNANVPAFTASVKSPSSMPNITFPKFTTTLLRTQPVTVKWTGSGSDSVSVVISDDAQTPNALSAILIGNEVTFTAAQMARLQPGTISVEVATFHSKLVVVGGKRYLISSRREDGTLPDLQ